MSEFPPVNFKINSQTGGFTVDVAITNYDLRTTIADSSWILRTSTVDEEGLSINVLN